MAEAGRKMKKRFCKTSEAELISRKLRAVRVIQDLYLATDSFWQLPDVLQFILRSLDDAFSFKQSTILLVNEAGDTLHFQSAWGYPEGYYVNPVKLGHGFIGVTARSGEVLRIGSLRRNMMYMNAIRTESVPQPDAQAGMIMQAARLGRPLPESLMVVPCIARTGVIGVIFVESQQAMAFDEIDQELLLMVAGQTARLIEEVRLAEWQHRRKEGLLQAKAHLHQFHVFLDMMISVSTPSSVHYTSAMQKQLQGFTHIGQDPLLSRRYFEEAAELFQTIGMMLEMARSRLSAVLLAPPSKEMEELLGGCLAAFEACHASEYAEVTRSLIKRLQHPQSDLPMLTNRELDIARLVAQGLSNAEIALQLHISVRTVTTHLDRIYNKLAVGSRTALICALTNWSTP
ncbi:helix-turn-helix transcriptional regulator [Paenibacillus xanthanilyticus]|uniref:LuxR C-terminal-related transcriptional regulator n=1 Tax=Paenibacillus xanthanilyticus TaxID=1783531 RepID=A0ABV8K3W4_9BACL